MDCYNLKDCPVQNGNTSKPEDWISKGYPCHMCLKEMRGNYNELKHFENLPRKLRAK